MKKYVFAIPVILLATLACVVSAATPTASLPATETSPAQVLFTQTPRQPTVPPTLTFTPLPIPPAGGPNPIRFAPGGTYLDVVDHVSAGSSKTYSVNAMKGQLMSISIHSEIPGGGWGYIPLQIKGADGTALCPPAVNVECTFWRGVLPSTQDYFVTVTPAGDIPQFTMRVAINPPGTANQYFTYYNSTSRASLTYSDLFAPVHFPSTANYKTEPELALELIDTNSYANTNLGEAYFLLSSTADPQIVSTCTNLNSNGASPEELRQSETINGYTFTRSVSVGVATGNIYDQRIYRTAAQGRCYEVIFFIHSSNIGNYPPGTVNEFGENDLLQKFNGILSTFSIK